MKFEYKILLGILVFGLALWGINLFFPEKNSNYYLSHPEMLQKDLASCLKTQDITEECRAAIEVNALLEEKRRLLNSKVIQKGKRKIVLQPGQQTTDPRKPGYINPNDGSVIPDSTLPCPQHLKGSLC